MIKAIALVLVSLAVIQSAPVGKALAAPAKTTSTTTVSTSTTSTMDMAMMNHTMPATNMSNADQILKACATRCLNPGGSTDYSMFTTCSVCVSMEGSWMSGNRAHCNGTCDGTGPCFQTLSQCNSQSTPDVGTGLTNFALQTGTIRGYTPMVRVAARSATECSMRCLTERTFTCLNFQYTSTATTDNCLLGNATVTASALTPATGVSFYVFTPPNSDAVASSCDSYGYWPVCTVAPSVAGVTYPNMCAADADGMWYTWGACTTFTPAPLTLSNYYTTNAAVTANRYVAQPFTYSYVLNNQPITTTLAAPQTTTTTYTYTTPLTTTSTINTPIVTRPAVTTPIVTTPLTTTTRYVNTLPTYTLPTYRYVTSPSVFTPTWYFFDAPSQSMGDCLKECLQGDCGGSSDMNAVFKLQPFAKKTWCLGSNTDNTALAIQECGTNSATSRTFSDVASRRFALTPVFLPSAVTWGQTRVNKAYKISSIDDSSNCLLSTTMAWGDCSSNDSLFVAVNAGRPVVKSRRLLSFTNFKNMECLTADLSANTVSWTACASGANPNQEWLLNVDI